MDKVRLGQVLKPASDICDVQSEAVYPQIGMLNFGRGTFKKADLLGAETKYKTLQRVRSGQVIYSKLKAFEGALSIVPPHHDGHFVSQEFPTFDIDPNKMDPDYLLQVFRSELFASQLVQGSKGVGARRERLHPTAFLSIEIPLPSIEEQRQIARHMEQYSTKAAELESSTEQWARAGRLLHQKLIEIDVPRRRIGDLIELQRRKVDVHLESTYREIGLRSFGRGVFHKAPITGFELAGKKVYEIVPGDLLVSNVFAWEGAVAVASDSERDFIGSHRFMTWMPKGDNVDVRYLAAYFTSGVGIELLRAASPGSAGRNKTLSISTFENLEIPFPGIDQQRRIADALQLQVRLSALHNERSILAQALPKAVRNEIFSKLV